MVMWRLAVAVLVGFQANFAYAQSTVVIGNAIVTPDGGTTSSRMGSILNRVLNVMDFGAKCDNLTDDSTAINATFAYARTLPSQGFDQAATVAFPPGKWCAINNTINVTGFRSGIIVRGGNIFCRATGKPCFDALFSKQMVWHDTTLWGDPSNRPTYGLQFGRISTANADHNTFYSLNFSGAFLACGVYNYASEVTTFIRPYIFNTVGGYALCQDGYNRFNITSQFVTQTQPQGTAASFLNNVILNGSFGSRGGADPIPLWMGGVAMHRYINSYACAGCAGDPALASHYVIIDTESSGLGVNTDLSIDMNFEGNNQTGVTGAGILFTSANSSVASVTVVGLSYTEHNSQIRTGQTLFGLDSMVTDITAQDLTVRYGNNVSMTPTVFGSPTLWTVNGSIQVPTSNWVAPASFSGKLCLSGSCGYQFSAGSAASPSAAIGAPTAGFFSPSTNTVTVATSGVARASWLPGGVTLLGSGGTASTRVNNNTFVPVVQAQDNVLGAAFSTDAAKAANLYLTKSHNTTYGTQTAVSSGEALGAVNSQGSDGVAAQSASLVQTEVDGSVTAGPVRVTALSATVRVISRVSQGGTGYTDGTFTVTLAGGTCSVQPTFSVTAAGGTVTTVNGVTEGGVCSVAPAGQNTPTGGTGTGLQLTVSYDSFVSTPGLVPGRTRVQTAGSLLYAVLSGSVVPAGSGGSGYVGTFTVTIPGGTCSVQPQFSVTANGSGAIATINSVVTAGSCTAPPVNPVNVTGGAGINGRITANYSALIDAMLVDSSQQIFLSNVAVTPTGKQPLCIDAATKQIYAGTGGVC